MLVPTEPAVPIDPHWVKREAAEVKRDVRRAKAHVEHDSRAISTVDVDDVSDAEDVRDRITSIENIILEERAARPRLKISGPFGITSR